MIFASLFLGLLATASAKYAYERASIGTSITRTFTEYVSMPLTVNQTAAAGFYQKGACVQNLGIPYVSKDGVTESAPFTLYFTPGGQVAGMDMTIFGDVPQELVDAGFWQKSDIKGDKHHLTVSFRREAHVCSSDVHTEALGDQLVINQGTLDWSIPLKETDAELNKWSEGSCIDMMGYHWTYDLDAAPTMTWKASSMVPIVAMYHEGFISAFFFASSTSQKTRGGVWETRLTNSLMCANFCKADHCDWTDSDGWSTLHIFLKDYESVDCGCKTLQASCCRDGTGWPF